MQYFWDFLVKNLQLVGDFHCTCKRFHHYCKPLAPRHMAYCHGNNVGLSRYHGDIMGVYVNYPIYPVAPFAPGGSAWERNLPPPPEVCEMTPIEQEWYDEVCKYGRK